MKKEASLSSRINTCFKGNDVRCIAGKELDKEIAYRTGRAVVTFLKCKEFIVGHDMRLSSHRLRDAFIKGITDQGANVLKIGELDSPGLYFASGFLKKPAGMITASHNPAKYNGIKLVKAGALPIGENSGLLKIKALVVVNKFPKPKKRGKIKKINIFPQYTKHIHSFIRKNKIKNLKIVIDAGNGMAAKMVPLIYKGLKIKYTPLDFKLDGSFPTHEANPAKPKNILDLRKKVKQTKADFGIAFDGDMDRVFFIDETGKAIDASVIASLIIKKILAKKKGPVIYTSTMSKIITDTIKKYRGHPILEKVGHAFIKNRMKSAKALFGCENSAHYYYKNNFHADSGLISSLIVCELASQNKQQGKKFSHLLKEFQKYAKAPEQSFKVKDKPTTIKKAEKKYKNSAKKINKFDGLTISLDNWWFNLRPSNTEPLLRLNIEAKNKKLLAQKKKELIKLIKKS